MTMLLINPLSTPWPPNRGWLPVKGSQGCPSSETVHSPATFQVTFPCGPVFRWHQITSEVPRHAQLSMPGAFAWTFTLPKLFFCSLSRTLLLLIQGHIFSEACPVPHQAQGLPHPWCSQDPLAKPPLALASVAWPLVQASDSPTCCWFPEGRLFSTVSTGHTPDTQAGS